MENETDNATTLETADDDDEEKCLRSIGVSESDFYRFVLIPAIIIIFTLSYLKGRQCNERNKFLRLPAIVWPVNLFQEKRNRLPYVAAFNICVWSITRLLTGESPFDFVINPSVKSLVLLASGLLIALIFYPIFGAIASNNVIGYGLGTLYIWMLTLIYWITHYPCEQTAIDRQILDSLAILPCAVWMLFLCIFFPYQFIGRVLAIMKGEKTYEITQETYTFEFQYVKTLLNRKEEVPLDYADTKNRLDTLLETIRQWFSYRRYVVIPGFRYSISILTAVSVSLLLVWTIAIRFVREYLLLIAKGKAMINSFYGPGAGDENSTDTSVGNLVAESIEKKTKSGELARALYWWHCIEIAMYVSLAGAFLWTTICLLLTLKNYRSNLFRIYKGVPLDLPNTDGWTPSNVVVLSAKYIGFQFGYSFYGFCVQAVVLASMFSVFTYATVKIFVFKDYNFLIRIVQYWGPLLGYFIGVLIIQRLLVHFVFLEVDEKKNKVLAIRRLPLFYNFQYFMIFANSAIGLVSCLLRIFKSVVLGAFGLPRLDMSTLPRNFEHLDNGFHSYVSLLAMENTQTNPVLVTFVNLLWQSLHRDHHNVNSTIANGQCRKESKENELSSASIGGLVTTCANNSHLMQSRRKRIIRNRWHVYVFLIQNSELRRYRRQPGAVVVMLKNVTGFGA